MAPYKLQVTYDHSLNRLQVYCRRQHEIKMKQIKIKMNKKSQGSHDDDGELKHLNLPQFFSRLLKTRILLFRPSCQDFKNSDKCLHTVSPVKEGKDQISHTLFFQHIGDKTC